MPRASTFTCTTLALALFGFGCDDDSTTSPDDALREAKIDIGGAIAAAESAEPTGVVVEVEFEQRNDVAIYDVALLVGDEVHEVTIDPVTGKVVATAVDPEDLEEARASAAALSTAKIDMREAIALATRAADGSAFEIEVDADGFEVLVLGDAGATEVEVGLDGTILAKHARESGVEVEDEEDEQDEQDERDEQDDDDSAE